MKKAAKAAITISSVFAGMYLVNECIKKATPPLSSVLDGRQDYFTSEYGKIFYVERGEGEPLILIHGLASGTSSFVWRKNFTELSKHFKVYALDMPGFGKSDKQPITYTSSVYRNIIKSFIQNIIGEPVNIVASSQCAAYAIELAYDNPGIFKKIICISPTGIFELADYPKLWGKTVNLFFKLPISGTFMYNMLVSEPSVKYFLKKNVYYNKDYVTKYVIKYYKKSARQNGMLSKFAPSSFLSGYTNENILNSLPNVECPVLILWGENAAMNPLKNLKSFLDVDPGLMYYVFKRSGNLPQEEHPIEFNEICCKFLQEGKI